MKVPSVSMIIPTYRAAKVIGRAVNQILQHYRFVLAHD